MTQGEKIIELRSDLNHLAENVLNDITGIKEDQKTMNVKLDKILIPMEETVRIVQEDHKITKKFIQRSNRIRRRGKNLKKRTVLI